MVKLSVIVPVYNESESIIPLYSEILDEIKLLKKNKKITNYEIIFVNDGSRDNSSNLLSELSQKDKNVKFIDLRKNFGQTPALKAGFDNCSGDLIVTLDGDLQNDPKDISSLIAKLSEGYDVVSGWRFNRKDKFFKRISSKMMNFLRKKLIGDQLHDYGCSLKIYKRECLNDMELFGELHRYITAYLFIRGYKIGEIKVNHRQRKFGKTKYGFRRGINGILDLFYLKFWATYSNRPLHFFGRLGIYQWVLAVIILFEQIIKSFVLGVLSLGPLLMLSAVLGLTGLLFIIFGFLSEIITRSYFSTKQIYSIKKITN
ncbi:glycosyltransferase family 2 protein [Candidatus Pacearchaeota archaeon]|nr:glycosyltransferase family 2 protein [Candidatus Pacearchaeota archaeon]